MTNPPVVRIVPHWPNLMGQIWEQTFATLYATPPLPYCYVLAAVTEALESISFFVMCVGGVVKNRILLVFRKGPHFERGVFEEKSGYPVCAVGLP